MPFPTDFWMNDVVVTEPGGNTQAYNGLYFASDKGAKWFIERIKQVCNEQDLDPVFPEQIVPNVAPFVVNKKQWVWPVGGVTYNVGERLNTIQVYDEKADGTIDSSPVSWSTRFISSNLLRAQQLANVSE